MKSIIITALLLATAVIAKAQSPLQIKFMVNNTTIVIEKQLVSFKSRDTLKIQFVGSSPINLDEVWIQPFNKRQKGQSTVLVAGAYKKVRGFKEQKNYTIKIPLSNFDLVNLTKLKINFVNCTGRNGEILIKNNKAYEIFSSR